MKYYVIESTNLNVLITQVNLHMSKHNAAPQGGIAVYHEHENEDDIEGSTVFFQAMLGEYHENP